jgi:hypothetical protein
MIFQGGLLIRPSLKRRTAGLEFDKRSKKVWLWPHLKQSVVGTWCVFSVWKWKERDRSRSHLKPF